MRRRYSFVGARDMGVPSSWIAILMVLDTSAIIAAIANEQDTARYQTAMLSSGDLLLSSVAVLEAKIALSTSGAECRGPFQRVG
jgi:uncharacterized protein with PIN domain